MLQKPRFQVQNLQYSFLDWKRPTPWSFSGNSSIFGTVNPSLTFMGNLYACLVFRQIDFPLLLDISKNTNIKEW